MRFSSLAAFDIAAKVRAKEMKAETLATDWIITYHAEEFLA